MNQLSTGSPDDGRPPSTGGHVSDAGIAAPGNGGSLGRERRLGFAAADLDDLQVLPDDIEALSAAIEPDGAPFHGAFVPVVLHDTGAAERSYDAAEWAADLIRASGGSFLAVATYAEPDWAGPHLNPRQWNHAVAMIERIDGVCQRFGLMVVVRETIGDDPTYGDERFDPERPVRYLIDTGQFVADGFIPAQLVRPQGPGVDGGLVERLRSLMRDRS